MPSLCAATATATGVIITAVAVLDIHIEINAEAAIKPKTVREGSVPIHNTIRKAMRRWRCQRSMDLPMKKPAMKRKMISLPYSAATVLSEATPAKGSSTSGKQRGSRHFYRLGDPPDGYPECDGGGNLCRPGHSCWRGGKRNHREKEGSGKEGLLVLRSMRCVYTVIKVILMI
jgi:hypothetical protein